MFDRIRADIQAALDRDPAARGRLEVLFCYPGLHAVVLHRVGHWLWQHRLRLMARCISHMGRFLTGVEIHPAADIGTLYHGVRVGGRGMLAGMRHPTRGKNGVVGVGASVLGSIMVGDNALVGAGSVVLKPVAPDTTVVGVPARVVRHQGKRVAAAAISGATQDDPCEQCQEAFAKEIDRLERKLAELEQRLSATMNVAKAE